MLFIFVGGIKRENGGICECVTKDGVLCECASASMATEKGL